MNLVSKIAVALLVAVYVAASAAASAKQPAAEDNILALPEWPVASSDYGGKLLLSDSPEMVPDDGIMYQDTVSGEFRLFFHHVNDTEQDKKIVVLLENNSRQPASITVLQYGLGGPEFDYLKVGKDVQEQYFRNNNLYLIEVQPGSTKLLDATLGQAIVQPNMLVNGMYDIKTDQPITVKVMMLPVEQDILEFADCARILPADEHRLRGTFEGKDRLLVGSEVYTDKEGRVAITLADHMFDRYVTGIDATDGSAVLNYGNYGIVYKLFIPTAYSTDVSYYLNPRGGVYAGALGIKYRQQYNSVLQTPNDSLFFGEGTETNVQHLGQFDGGQSLWFTFSPPGASNLPIKLIIVPETAS